MAVAELEEVEDFQSDAFTKQFVVDKLTHLHARMTEVTESNMLGLRAETLGFIGDWLGVLCEIDELFWMPTTEKEKRIMEWRNG